MSGDVSPAPERRLASAAFWVSAAELCAGGISLLTTVVAARLLLPSDFGLMGTVLLAMSVLEAFSQSGFEQALIQRDKDVDRLLDAAWSWQVLRGLLLAALLAALTPWLTEFYDEPRVAPLMWVTCSVFVLKGFYSVGPVLYSRELNFKKQFWIKLSQTALGGLVYLPALFLLRNVWALCVHLVGTTLIGLVVSYLAHPHRPRFTLHRPALAELLRFGKWVSWSGALIFVITQGDDLFVSKYFGLAALGLYQMAYGISNLPATQVTHVISRASLAAYSRLQSDRAAVRQLFLRIVRNTLLISSCASVAIWFVIPLFVRFVVTDKWSGIVPLVRILVLAGFVRSFAAVAGALFQGLGRPELDFRMQLPRFVVLVALIWPAAMYGGLAGVCLACLASIAATLPHWFTGVQALIGVRPADVVKQAGPATVAAALLGVVLYGLLLLARQSPLTTAFSLLGALAVWACLLWLVDKAGLRAAGEFLKLGKSTFAAAGSADANGRRR